MIRFASVPRGPLVTVALCAIAATVIDLGPFHRLHDGDSLQSVLLSLYRWQPFPWEQDRFGMLVPLLTAGMRDPFATLLVQSWLTCFSMLAGFFALAAIATGARSSFVAGALSSALFLATAGEYWRFMLLSTVMPNYGLALAAAGAALLLRDEGVGRLRWIAGAAFLALGAWVNTGAPLVIAPAVMVRMFLAGQPAAGAPRRRGTIVLLMVMASLAGSMWMSTTAPVRMNYGLLPPSDWPACWAGLLRNAGRDGVVSPAHLAAWGVLVLATVALAGSGVVNRRRIAGAGAPLVAGAAALWLALGALNWVKSQGLAGRYLLPAVVTLDAAVAGAFTTALLERFRAPRLLTPLRLAAGGTFLAVVAALYLPPSVRGVRNDLDVTIGTRTQEVLDAGITHVAGSYWTVWPTVFHANMVLHEMGSERSIWGLAHRASPTSDRWARIPFADWRVAAIPQEFEDPWTRQVYRAYRLPALVPVDTLGTFTVFVVARAAAR